MIRKLFSWFTGRPLWLAAALLAVAGVAAAAAFTLQRPGSLPVALKGFQEESPPKAAPEISFTDADGRQLSLADFRGKVVLLNFWATWCVPCVEEMPSLDKLQALLGGPDFTVVALSTDREGLSVVRPFIDKLGVRNLALYLDQPRAAQRAFGLRGIPTTMLIDREGRERGRLEGMARWDSAEAVALIRRTIGRSSPPLTKVDAGR
jgi:thiol-disulfide isomerase/thioredoxin